MAKTYTTPCFESDADLYGLELDSDEYKEYKQEMEKSGRIIQRRMTEATKKPVLEIRRLEHQVLQEMLPEYSLYHVLYISSDPRKHGPNIYRQWAVMAIRNDMPGVVSMRVVIEVSQQGELKLIGFFHYGGEV